MLLFLTTRSACGFDTHIIIVESTRAAARESYRAAARESYRAVARESYRAACRIDTPFFTVRGISFFNFSFIVYQY
jgi:hypothetical protein